MDSESQHIAVPPSLRRYTQFVNWRLATRPGQDKPTKVPVGSVTDSTTWGTYDQVVAALSTDNTLSGIGFVFTESDPFVFIDIDNAALPDGNWHADALNLINSLPGTVWETSQSGKGLHGIARADKTKLHRKRNRFSTPNGIQCEFYYRERYMALGMANWNGNEPLDITKEILENLPDREVGANADPNRELVDGPRPNYVGPKDDGELIRRACEATGSAAAAFGAKISFRQLWEADVTALQEHFPDETSAFDWSLADAALMERLAFWTGYDEARMERLFSRSALSNRDKWINRPDYRVRTVTATTGRGNARYIGSDRADRAKRATFEARVEHEDFVPEAVYPDKADHEYMMYIMFTLNYDVRYDQFREIVRVDGEPLSDALEVQMWLNACSAAQMNFAKEKFRDTIQFYAHKRPYHPVRDYLNTIQTTYDGKPRLDTWLIDYAGAPDTPYVRAVAAKTMIAAVRRIRRPGTKHDEMLILEGPQGLGKSTLFRALCPDPSWFTDAVTLSMDTKEIMENTGGRWIVEAPELSKLSGAEIEHVKALLSRDTDLARLSYGRSVTERPRQFIFVGSTNATEYLIDQSGNRRFWPVEATRIDVAALEEVRDAIWSEAAHREASGEPNGLPTELWEAARAEQAIRQYGNPYQDRIADLLGTKTGSLAIGHLYDVLGIVAKDRNRHTRTIHSAMLSLGWSYQRNTRTYVKGDPARVLQAFGSAIEPAPTDIRSVGP